jgi:hypothetical protein
MLEISWKTRVFPQGFSLNVRLTLADVLDEVTTGWSFSGYFIGWAGACRYSISLLGHILDKLFEKEMNINVETEEQRC